MEDQKVTRLAKARRDIMTMVGAIASAPGGRSGPVEVFHDIVTMDPTIFDTLGPHQATEAANEQGYIQPKAEELWDGYNHPDRRASDPDGSQGSRPRTRTPGGRGAKGNKK
eukprot:7795048-Heterocapsa_arctica.AAC.1